MHQHIGSVCVNIWNEEDVPSHRTEREEISVVACLEKTDNGIKLQTIMPKKRLSLVCNDDSYLGRRIKIFKVKKNSPVYDVKRIAADLKARQSSRAKEEFEKTQAERQLKKKKCDIIARMKQKSCAMTAGQGRITNSLPASTVAPPKPKQRKETSVRSPASDNMPSIALDEVRTLGINMIIVHNIYCPPSRTRTMFQSLAK